MRDQTCPTCGRRSQGDVERDIGLEAEARAEKLREPRVMNAERALTQRNQQGEAFRRHLMRTLEAMEWRFESYESVYACARELRELRLSLGMPVKRGRPPKQRHCKQPSKHG